jgi:hypothetical protein
MIDQRRELFERFGRLDTWIVGLQYYDGASAAVSQDVVFERDPDNPFDPNAVAVFTTTGTQVGHLPRYDAEYFSPLILQGVIALKGHAGESERGDRLPLALEVFATSKVSEVLVRDPRDDWRAIYHNVFIDIWERLPDYTSATLREFRDRFRPLAHDQPLCPKTQFLYRMLKAHIADREEQERQRLREQVLASVKAMAFGPVMGWPELTVIPLDTNGDASQGEPTPPDLETITALAHTRDKLPDVLRLLPSRCPYPAGARGAVVLVHGAWHSLDWFDSAECAQVYWFQMILSGIETALHETPPAIPADTDPEAVKARILEALQRAACTLTGTEEDDGGTRVDIATGDRAGHALYRDGKLIRLNVKERQYWIEEHCEEPQHIPPMIRE